MRTIISALTVVLSLLAVTPAAVVFDISDDFNRAAIGNNWRPFRVSNWVTNGSATARCNAALGPTTGFCVLARAERTFPAVQFAQADIEYVTADSNCAVGVRLSPDGTGYYAKAEATVIGLYKLAAGGGETQLQAWSKTLASDTPLTVKISVDDPASVTTITVNFDSTDHTQTDVTSPLLTGFPGIVNVAGSAGGACDIDNFSSTSPSVSTIDPFFANAHNGTTLIANATTTTLAIVAPAAVETDDVGFVFIDNKDNLDVTPPDGTWTCPVELDNTSTQRVTMCWKLLATTDDGATFNFTKGTDNNLLFAGTMVTFRNVHTTVPLGGITPSTDVAAAAADQVDFAAITPAAASFVCAVSYYNNDLTTFGAISGTDPAFAKYIDRETSTGSDASIAMHCGPSTGASTGTRAVASASTADDINVGALFAVFAPAAAGPGFPFGILSGPVKGGGGKR